MKNDVGNVQLRVVSFVMKASKRSVVPCDFNLSKFDAKNV